MLTSFAYKKGTLQVDLSRQDLAKAHWDKEVFIWVDFENPSDFESDLLVELFNFHPLAIEDCLMDHGEPKLDDYDEYLFLVVHALKKADDGELQTLELDLFVNKNFVVTFHKFPIPSVTRIRDEVRRKKGAPLGEGSDMLVHSMLDRLVDDYHPVIAGHERRIDEIEDHLFEQSGDHFLRQILKTQKEVLFLKRIMSPQRETISHLSRGARSFVKPKNLIYFRDIYDHLFRYHQMAEELNGILNGIMQVHFSHVSHRLNQVIKTMTVIATLALPMMVISGVYGMNFESMPELTWEYGYFLTLGLMVVVSSSLLLWMKTKKWL
jgi:magnesium transporter